MKKYTRKDKARIQIDQAVQAFTQAASTLEQASITLFDEAKANREYADTLVAEAAQLESEATRGKTVAEKLVSFTV